MLNKKLKNAAPRLPSAAFQRNYVNYFCSQENKLFTSVFFSQLLYKIKTKMKQQTLKKSQTPPGSALSLN